MAKDKQKKVLFVDDEPTVMQILKSRLESKNFIVVTAASGKEAIEQTKKEKPDLIILDEGMPELSGTDTCKILKKDPKTSAIPVVMFTALEQFGLEKNFFDAGAIAVVYKPTVSDLIKTVRGILSGKKIDTEGKEFLIG